MAILKPELFTNHSITLPESNIDLNCYNHIPAVKYRDTIAELCQPLKSFHNINLLCIAIMLNNGNIFYTSNDPMLAACYMESGLYRADNFFNVANNQKQSYFFPQKINLVDALNTLTTKVLQECFKIYNSYCLIRRCDDCTVFIAVTNNHIISDFQNIYNETVSGIEDLSINYFNKLIDIYVDQLPAIKYSRFAKDPDYRASVIRNRLHIDTNTSLTERETQCLYWVSRGKTASETAVLMGISEFTVNEYKKSIMTKLNVNNMVFGIREAIKRDIIS